MLQEFWASHRDAEASLRTWLQHTRVADWGSFGEVQKTLPSADYVKVASGRPVVVFNIGHNRYRLIAAVHYNTKIVYTLMILSHKGYDRNAWKEQL